MLITIYNSSGQEKLKIAPNDSSIQSQEIQGDNVLSLSFTLYECVSLDVNDYVVFRGSRYVMLESYSPEQASTVEWNYSVSLYGIESLIKRFLVLNTTDGDAEAVFTLTGPAAQHLELITRCINEGLGGNTWRPGRVESTGNIVISYEGKYCDEALKELAEQAGTEWWVEGNTINLGRCEHSEELALGYMEGLTSLEKQQDNQAKFFTRLFPIGSSRNIDPSVYGHSRLVLPGGKKSVDVEPLVKLYGVVHHYEKDAFSHIYPRRIGTLSAVRHEETQGEDGKKYDIYYFKDSGLNFDPNEYQLAGQVLRVSFQEGSELHGLGADDEHFFEVNYHSDTKEFEVITIWPYDDDTPLPGGLLVPKIGDTYILWNLRMPDEYYTLAEQEFEDAVREYNVKHGIDTAIYKASTDHVWFEANQIELQVGQRVRLNSREFFPQAGFRNSRITKIVRKVNYPTIMELEISDALSVGTMQKINDNITSVKNYTRQLSASVPDIIRSWEDIPATENNVLSAKRSYKEFLSKTTEDVAQKLITFLEGIKIGDGYGFDRIGRIIARSLELPKASVDALGNIIATAVKSKDFRPGLLDGKGFGMYTDDSGRTHVSADIIEARVKAKFAELAVQRFTFSSGDMGYTSAGCKMVKVSRLPSGDFRCYWLATDGDTRTTNDWHVGDQAMARTHNIIGKTTAMAANRYYWRLVVAVGEEILQDGNTYHYIDLSDTRGTLTLDINGTEHTCVGYDTSVDNDVPKEGDEIVQMGSQTDVDRQYAYVVYVSEGKRVDYDGINDYDLDSHIVEIHSRDVNYIFSNRFEIVSGGNIRTPLVADRGQWHEGAVSYHYDRWSHNNAMWLCNVGKGKQTASEPGDGNAEWIKETYGIKGEERTQLILDIVEGSVFYRPGQSHIATIEASIIKGNTDITQEYHPSQIVWTRESEADDTHWNDTHLNAGTRLAITTADIAGKTAIVCTIYDRHGQIENAEKLNL